MVRSLSSGGCSKARTDKHQTPIVVAGLLTCLVLCVVLQIWTFGNGFRYDLWYDNCLICLAAVLLFELVTRIPNVPMQRAVQSLSIYSFGIYLVHYPIKILLDPVICQVATIVTMPFACIIFTIVILLISWAIVFAIGKIPKIGKPLLFLKK